MWLEVELIGLLRTHAKHLLSASISLAAVLQSRHHWCIICREVVGLQFGRIIFKIEWKLTLLLVGVGKTPENVVIELMW